MMDKTKIYIKSSLIRLLFVIFIISPLLQTSALAQNDKIKAIWVIRDAMVSKKRIDEVVQVAKTNGFNNIFAQVRGRGDAYYNSKIVEKSPLIKSKKFDPLEYLIKKAHKEGIKIHAWVNVYLTWSSPQKPTSDNHQLLANPDWFAKAYGEKSDAVKTRRQFVIQGSEGAYLSPGHPKVMKHLTAVFNELVDNYDIDGIHFDYLRYSGPEYDYNPESLREFRRLTGLDPNIYLEADAELIQVLGQGSVDDFHKKWKDYRLGRITALLRNVRQNIDRKHRGVKLSVAVKPNPEIAKDRYYQDWTSWVQAGLIDYAVPMNYSADLDVYLSNLQMILRKVPPAKLIMGIGAFNQNHFDLESKIYKSKVFGISNFIFFSYNEIKREPEYINAIRRALKD